VIDADDLKSASRVLSDTPEELVDSAITYCLDRGWLIDADDPAFLAHIEHGDHATN
jgi:hypothetical protein